MHQTKTNNNQFSIFNIQSQDGFTLIEIGIAIFILGVGLISMLTIFPIGVDSIKKVTQYSNAAVLTESAISYLKANDVVAFVGTNTGSNTYPDTDSDQGNPFEDSSGNTIFAQYSWQATVQNLSSNNNLVRAQIAIFRNFDSTKFGAGTADFTQTSTTVSSVSVFPSWLTSKHYIRASDNSSDDKSWYRIDSVGTSSSEIILEGNFLGTTGAGLTFSTTKDIIDIYETMFSKR
ncbi:MAG: type II secretion system protein [Candidatus Scalindua sp.]|jgi:type II secretory pathway pseudopilin PulG|nr:type II secretion system protein [Candidatus Scalindua sp.]MBT6226800.1 type II secretion system protein [Candidatus Scalindua sp.]